MASAIDLAIAKLDAILSAAGGQAAPAAAAAGKGAAVRPVPSGSELSESSGSQPSSATNVASAGAAAAAAAAPGSAALQAARQILATKAQIKVARITSAQKQPNSAKLLKLQADLGEGDTRQVMAGLQPYFPDPEQGLLGRLVCVVANLKPAKLAGEASQAMVLAASAMGPDRQHVVRTLVPPENACPGDLVHLDGVMPPPEYPKVLKLDDWRAVVPGLVVSGGKATFEGTPLVTSAGLVTLPPELPDGSTIA